ncbi:putative major surface protease GP63 [Leptomonas pyrrhocoris]|uniref:leishmanolysin n=1 Tax=Leptomonas pyrrhocoris TaxID=157538 RepID=A0A0N1J5G3_LEPPY|nr:putative major surface protease GP63 [Leptomonas pyrrhocoris]KPA86218.1 putative major surface protease GP63 [Leptomonas pyrrhocoris]|eukprot:XP_015664657.1 putative major surface protease GP63 [Leptomonas pyrrhocoris]
MRHQLVAVLFLLSLLQTRVFVTADAPSVARHRCIHRHSNTLQRITKAAAELNVEYVASNTSTPTATKSLSVADDGDAFLLDRPSRTVSALAAEPPAGLGGKSGLAAAAQTPRDLTYPPMRIRFDVSHLFNASHFCTDVGSQRSDKLGGNVTCKQDDLFRAWKRDFVLHRIIPILGSSVEQWLSLKDAVAADQNELTTAPRDAGGNRASRVIVPQGICGSSIVVPHSHSTKGVYNADFIVYVLAAPLHDTVTTTNSRASASTSSRTIAWATYCAVDRRTKRPLVAVMNFVPSSLVLHAAPSASASEGASSSSSFWLRTLKRAWRTLVSSSTTTGGATEKQLRSAVYNANQAISSYYAQWTAQHHRSLLHELLHALGFAPSQLQRYAAMVTLRRASTSTTSAAALVITTPKVKVAVQSWMNCTSAKALPGAALERSGSEGTVGAHWERLQFHDDLMAGVLSPSAALSDMTIAFFDSLPYYRADRRYAEHPMWGYHAGCDFAAGVCRPVGRFAAFDEASSSTNSHRPYWTTDAESVTRSRYWCEAMPPSAAGHTQCTADRRAIGFCFAQREPPNKGSSAGDRKRSPAAPSVESHGLSLLMEGCPIVEPYSNRVCDSSPVFESPVGDATGADFTEDNVHYQRSVLVKDQGYYFGPFSRCFASSEVRRLDRETRRALAEQMSRATDSSAGGVNGVFLSSSLSSNVRRAPVAHPLVTARCLQTRCLKGGTAVEVRVGTEWIQCPADGGAGVVAVPPTSGYAGWVGCEAAVLYCADATQLQRPTQLLSNTPPATSKTSSTVLPFYRVTVTFSISLSAAPVAQPLTVTAETAATFRMSLVDSDRAFQAALQRDLARHRARRALSPLGAVMGQRVAGATRLTTATFAAFAEDGGDDVERRNSSRSGAFPLNWKGLVSADLEVVAHGADEALSRTQAWLVATPKGATAPLAVTDGARLSEVELISTAEWLSRSSCAALASTSRADNNSYLLSVDETGSLPISSSVLPAETDAAEPAVAPRAVCQVRGLVTSLPVRWKASARNHTATFSVVGPLDVSEHHSGAIDLREVAVVHLRFRRNHAAAMSALWPNSTTATQRAPALDVEAWVSQAASLLALAKDMGALLGLSSQMVRVASIRRSANIQEPGHGTVNTSRAKKAADGLSPSLQDAMDVGFVVSLPMSDEATLWDGAGAKGSAASSASDVLLSWTAFTARVRVGWLRQLTELVDGEGAEERSLCLLRHANALFQEQQRDSAEDGTAFANATLAVRCPIVLDAVVRMHAPRPGASAEDLFLGSSMGKTEPWWERRVVEVRGFTVTVASFLGSVLVAVVLVLCACRSGR